MFILTLERKIMSERDREREIVKVREASYLLRGLDMARGVGTPMALIRCCIVGDGPARSMSGVWLRDNSRPRLQKQT